LPILPAVLPEHVREFALEVHYERETVIKHLLHLLYWGEIKGATIAHLTDS
jgi:hypothetical protein